MRELKHSIRPLSERKLLSDPDLGEYLGVGRNTARNIALKAGAKIKIGRRTLNDRKKIDQYIDSLGA